MKKVAIIVSSLNAGGVENYLLRFLTYTKGEFEPLVICRMGITGDLFQGYQELGVNVIPQKVGFFNLYSWVRLYRLLKRKNLHSICDFTGNFAGIPLFIARLANVKTRIACYVGASNHFKEDLFRLAYNKLMNKMVLENATSILSNSKTAVDCFFGKRALKNNRFEVIYNGIDVNGFLGDAQSLRNELGIPEKAFVYGHVGRYNKAKNHETAIEVAINLCKKRDDIYFLFCGKDTDVALVDRVVKEGLQKRILLLGVRSDVSSVLKTMNAFYFPSVTEGQPNALIEAMISDLPFITSDINPIKETVPENHHHQLIDPLDDVKATNMLWSFYENRNFENWKCTNWARDFYKPDVRFNQFLNQLLK